MSWEVALKIAGKLEGAILNNWSRLRGVTAVKMGLLWWCEEDKKEFEVQSRTFLDTEAIFECPATFVGRVFLHGLGKVQRWGGFCRWSLNALGTCGHSGRS